jgi:hypothetical protein
MLHDINFASSLSCNFNELVGEGEAQQKAIHILTIDLIY